MIPPWTYLDEQNRAVFRATVAFLDKRLADSATIEWALRLKPTDHIQRIAIDNLLRGPGGRILDEPWATAWRLIEESWSAAGIEEGPSTEIYDVQRRLRATDRSGAIVSAIVKLVAPRLKVEPIDAWRWRFVKKPRRPKRFNDLLSARLSSGDLLDLNLLELENLSDVPFLTALSSALEGAVSHGLDIARRLGWDNEGQFWQLGDLARVYYVFPAPRADGDPDAHHHGIAPSVKLLYAVVARIADLEPKAALQFVQRWRLAGSPVHIRLWAAAARNSQLISGMRWLHFCSGSMTPRFGIFMRFLRSPSFGRGDLMI